MRWSSGFVPLIALVILSISANAGLRAVNPKFDFGEVGIDFDFFHTFFFVNESSETIVLDSLDVPCECSVARLTDSSVAAGDTLAVTVKFNTANIYGHTSKSIVVYTLKPRVDSVRVDYTADVEQWRHQLRPNPINLFFLPIHKELAVRVGNIVHRDVTITEIATNDTLFTVTPDASSVGAGDELVIRVKPRDSLRPGEFHGSFRLSLSVDGFDDPVRMSIPVKIVRY